MDDPYLVTLHTLTLRQLANAEQISDISGLDVATAQSALERGVEDGTVMAARGSSMVTPKGREQLDQVYPEAYAGLRADEAVRSAFEQFETGVNPRVLELMTAWQQVEVNGQQTTNDHSDAEYDAKIIDRLGTLHERAEKVLRPLTDAEPGMEPFLERLGQALLRAERGETDYVSGLRVDSYHTVWFQMHEHILRMLGRERQE